MGINSKIAGEKLIEAMQEIKQYESLKTISDKLSKTSPYTPDDIMDCLLMIRDNTRNHGFTLTYNEYLAVMENILMSNASFCLDLKETMRKVLFRII